MAMLAHRFPRVRRWTAEQLYVRLVEDGSALARNGAQVHLDSALKLLLEIDWDQSLDAPGCVRNSRNRVADLLGVKLSEKVREGTRKKKKVKASVVDEFESYASLVDEFAR